MPDAATTAETLVQQLRDSDASAEALGVRLVDAGVGRATVALTVRADMGNGLGVCHGGVIFTLADCAFEYACNSRGRATVAAGASIEFIRSATVGDELTAKCDERHRGRTTGTYDVTVTNSEGKTIALFRGRSHEVAGPVLPELPES